jgi:hypothetical protein
MATVWEQERTGLLGDDVEVRTKPSALLFTRWILNVGVVVGMLCLVANATLSSIELYEVYRIKAETGAVPAVGSAGSAGSGHVDNDNDTACHEHTVVPYHPGAYCNVNPSLTFTTNKPASPKESVLVMHDGKIMANPELTPEMIKGLESCENYLITTYQLQALLDQAVTGRRKLNLKEGLLYLAHSHKRESKYVHKSALTSQDRCNTNNFDCKRGLAQAVGSARECYDSARRNLPSSTDLNQMIKSTAVCTILYEAFHSIEAAIARDAGQALKG